MIKATVRLTLLALMVLSIAVGLVGCDMAPVDVQISGPPIANVGATITMLPTNATDEDVTYNVTVADKTGKQRGSYQVVWKKNEKRNPKSTSFSLTAEEDKLYTGKGPDGMGKDITSNFKITVSRR
jgi:hypothetical protein